MRVCNKTNLRGSKAWRVTLPNIQQLEIIKALNTGENRGKAQYWEEKQGSNRFRSVCTGP